MNVYLTRPYVFLKQGPASSPSSTFWNVEALHSPPPSMNDSQRMSGGQRCPDPRPLKNTGAGPGDTSEARLRCWVTSWFPDSSRCAQITVLSTSLAVALFVRPVGPALYLLHFSKNAAYAQPSLVLRLLCLPHPPGAQAQVLLGLAWGSGPGPPGPRLGLGPGSSWASPGARAQHCLWSALLHSLLRGHLPPRQPHRGCYLLHSLLRGRPPPRQPHRGCYPPLGPHTLLLVICLTFFTALETVLFSYLQCYYLSTSRMQIPEESRFCLFLTSPKWPKEATHGEC